jgi:hypothetical protein
MFPLILEIPRRIHTTPTRKLTILPAIIQPPLNSEFL